jgi:hypothetical protein
MMATAAMEQSLTSLALAYIHLFHEQKFIAVLINHKVVLSFVLASFMTTTASILAMILDQAFDAKGQFTLKAPIKYLGERFLDTEWKKDYAWRPFLDPLIIGLGDQQLITGYAVLLSGWIKVCGLLHPTIPSTFFLAIH